MAEKKIDIANTYVREISEIKYKLQLLEGGYIYEFTNAQCDGALATNVSKLKEMLNDLFRKIEYGDDSDTMNDIFR